MGLVKFEFVTIKECFLENCPLEYNLPYCNAHLVAYDAYHLFSDFPVSYLGRIIFGFCFSQANFSFVRCIITVRS